MAGSIVAVNDPFLCCLIQGAYCLYYRHSSRVKLIVKDKPVCFSNVGFDSTPNRSIMGSSFGGNSHPLLRRFSLWQSFPPLLGLVYSIRYAMLYVQS